ncbi:MAG: serine hydrolase [Candidatus Glassbacteria bacterium]|nr:serine hydrolase [Candidatus Glassbacteria bacterium]
MKISGLSLILLVSGVLAPGCGPEPGDSARELSAYYPPAESAGGWRKNTDPQFVRSLGLDPDKLEEFGRYNLSVPNSGWMPYAGYKGILVIRRGWVVGEWYNVPGAATFRTYISSNGKSFALACFGIMNEDSRSGRLGLEIGPDSKVYDPRWLPQGYPLSDSLKALITFEQVFRHTSGLCPERKSSGEEVEMGRNEWTDYTDWVLGHDSRWPQTAGLYFRPGHPEDFEARDAWGMVSSSYSSVGFCHLGLVLQNVYGKPAGDFLWERLLGPLGFSGIDYHAPPGPGIRWFSAGGLRVTPREYARFAYLLLRDGRWGDSRLVPASWIRRFRTSPLYPNMRSNADGYFGEQYPKDMFRIAGSGLNWAYIVPSLDLIALRTGRGHNEMWEEVRGKFLEKIFAAVTDR